MTLSNHSKAALTGFEQQIQLLTEVLLCLHLSGACDFILHVAAPDTGAYHEMLMEYLCALEHCVNIQTFILLKARKTDGVYAL